MNSKFANFNVFTYGRARGSVHPAPPAEQVQHCSPDPMYQVELPMIPYHQLILCVNSGAPSPVSIQITMLFIKVSVSLRVAYMHRQRVQMLKIVAVSFWSLGCPLLNCVDSGEGETEAGRAGLASVCRAYQRLRSLQFERPVSLQMDILWGFLSWILMLSMGPIALVLLMLMALLNIFQFILKAALLFSIVAIGTPFSVMVNSTSFFLLKVAILYESSANGRRWEYPSMHVGIEFRIIVSNFFKVVAGELLLILSTGVITLYTAPLLVFYISMAVGLMAILLKWLNTSSLSKTAFSCLCEGFGLNPMMFWFSFMGLLDIGCHPIAKCSFTAKRAFLFTNDNPIHFLEAVTSSESRSIELPYGSFEMGLVMLCPRIDFIIRNDKKYILKSFMGLKLCGVKICDYPVERLELPEDYTKTNQLLNFLDTLVKDDGFVTDKMRGRYQHSLTLLEIVDGVGRYDGYRTVDPVGNHFIEAG